MKISTSKALTWMKFDLTHLSLTLIGQIKLHPSECFKIEGLNTTLML